MMFKSVIIIILLSVAVSSTWAAGDPISALLTPSISIPSLNIDNKEEVSCLKLKNKKTFVMLAIGQSLVANQNGTPTWWRSGPKKVFEFWQGHCYMANYPLYGATGDSKSFLLPLADLQAQATKSDVLLLTIAVGGADIARFARKGDINELILRQLNSLSLSGLYPNVIIFEQGQADRNQNADYFKKNISSMITSLRNNGFKAPIFLSIDTRFSWTTKQEITYSKVVPSSLHEVYEGPKVDLIVNRPDGTHMDEDGIKYMAGMWFQVISRHFRW